MSVLKSNNPEDFDNPHWTGESTESVDSLEFSPESLSELGQETLEAIVNNHSRLYWVGNTKKYRNYQNLVEYIKSRADEDRATQLKAEYAALKQAKETDKKILANTKEKLEAVDQLEPERLADELNKEDSLGLEAIAELWLEAGKVEEEKKRGEQAVFDFWREEILINDLRQILESGPIELRQILLSSTKKNLLRLETHFKSELNRIKRHRVKKDYRGTLKDPEVHNARNKVDYYHRT